MERYTFKIAHISDLHVDYDYLEGSNANCKYFVCCQMDRGTPLTIED